MKNVPGVPHGSSKKKGGGSGKRGGSDLTPYEAVPQLSGNEAFIEKMTELRDLKRRIDADEERLNNLKMECGAMVAVSGQKSVSFIDLRITNADGGTTATTLTGESLIEHLPEAIVTDPDRWLEAIYQIAMAAKQCDRQKLIQNGIPAHVVQAATIPGKPKSGSTQLGWVGASGKNAKKKADLSGGAVH